MRLVFISIVCFGYIYVESAVIEMNCCLPYGQQHGDSGALFRNDSMNLLSLDLRVSIVKYLPFSDIYHFMRSCQFNLYASRKRFHELLLSKFQFLLTMHDNAIKMKHLFGIPFIDSTHTCNFCISKHIHNKSNSSIFIGIDGITNKPFISFLVKKASTKRAWTIIFRFNETDIESILVSEQPFIRWTKTKALNYTNYALNDVTAITALILNGKIDSMLGESASWFLKSSWDERQKRKRDQLMHERAWNGGCCFAKAVAVALLLAAILFIILGILFAF